DIRLGRGSEMVSELTELVAAYPLREGFVAALMRALAGSGRSAEALTVYQRTRERLVQGLGVDPAAGPPAPRGPLLAGGLGDAWGEWQDEPARRADQLRRQGRRRRRGRRSGRRLPAGHLDRAGWFRQDQAGHGDRTVDPRRAAGWGVVGGVGPPACG